MLIPRRSDGLDNPHRVRGLCVLAVHHEHAFALHLLVKDTVGKEFLRTVRLNLQPELDFDGVRIVLLEALSRVLEDGPIRRRKQVRYSRPRKF